MNDKERAEQIAFLQARIKEYSAALDRYRLMLDKLESKCCVEAPECPCRPLVVDGKRIGWDSPIRHYKLSPPSPAETPDQSPSPE